MRSPQLLFKHSRFKGIIKKITSIKFSCLLLLVHGYKKPDFFLRSRAFNRSAGLTKNFFNVILQSIIFIANKAIDTLFHFRQKTSLSQILKSCTSYRLPQTIINLSKVSLSSIFTLMASLTPAPSLFCGTQMVMLSLNIFQVKLVIKDFNKPSTDKSYKNCSQAQKFEVENLAQKYKKDVNEVLHHQVLLWIRN